MFKTIDGGTKWIHAGLAGFTVVALAIDPRDTKVVYADVAIANDEGDLIEPQVFKTLNGGRTWAAASTGLPTVCGLGSLLVDSLGPGTLYAWTGCGGVFRRDDAADAWQPVNSGLPDREPGSGIGPMAKAMNPEAGTFLGEGAAKHFGLKEDISDTSRSE